MLRRTAADPLLEGGREGVGVPVANLTSDGLDLVFGGREQMTGFLHSQKNDVLERGTSDLARRNSSEVFPAHRSDLGHFRNRPGMGEVGFDGLPQPPEPLVSVAGLAEGKDVVVDETHPELDLRRRGLPAAGLRMKPLDGTYEHLGVERPFDG